MPLLLIVLMLTAMEAFIGFLQGFVYIMLLKMYSDDSLFTVTKETYDFNKNLVNDGVYEMPSAI